MGMTIIIALVTFVVGGLLVWFVMRVLMKSRYDAVIREAEKESEVMKQKKLLEVKEKFLHLKADLEKQVSARNSKIQSVEAKLKQRELNLNQRQEDLQRKNSEVDAVKENLAAQLVNHSVGGKNTVNGVAENEDHQRQKLRGRKGKADGGPDPGAHFLQLSRADHVAQNDLSGLRRGDGVHVGNVGQHTAVDLGADRRRTHEIDEAEDECLGHVIGKGLRAGGQGDPQQGAERRRREGPEISEGKTI